MYKRMEQNIALTSSLIYFVLVTRERQREKRKYRNTDNTQTGKETRNSYLENKKIGTKRHINTPNIYLEAIR